MQLLKSAVNKFFYAAKNALPSLFWFIVGIFLTLAFLLGITLFILRVAFANRVFEGVYIGDIPVGGKTQEEIKLIFDKKNKTLGESIIVFSYQGKTATVSASQLEIGYNSPLIAQQAYSIGRSNNPLSNLYLVLSAYFNSLVLPPSYTINQEKIDEIIEPFQKEIYQEPVDALFKVENNRVVAFRESQNGLTIDTDLLKARIGKETQEIMNGKKNVFIEIPVKIVYPKITTDKANNLGVVEMIGEGKSYFQGSIPNRVHNIALATSRLTGILIAPGETFSFNKALGDVSRFTGYKEAYIIQNGRTILGDGGGVCQVSTTLFRAVLNSGLPVVERHAHSYRVGYYEQGGYLPGLDATVFAPDVDFKFKNDTSSYILIQSYLDPTNLSLTFMLYGKKDGRKVTISTPQITRETPPPPPLYQDDPSLQKGVIKQVDFAAWGANVYFTRTVEKNGNILYSDNFYSNYSPWQAVYLRGTKE